MVNQELAKIFNQMAEILEFLGDPSDRFRIRAYQNVALTIESLPESVEKLVAEDRLRKVKGIGQGIAAKIEEYIENGEIEEYELLKRAVPKGIFELFTVPTLGPKRIKMLHDQLGVGSIAALKKAIADGSLQKLPGLGEKSAQKMLEGLEISNSLTERRSIGTVFLAVKTMIAALEKCEGISRVVPAGSFRRAEETVGDIDLLASGDMNKSKKIMKCFRDLPLVERVLVSGETKTSIVTKDGLQVDLRLVAPDEFGSALQYFTGSKQHNVALRTIAKARGMKLSEYGFFKGEKRVASKTEEECYASLNMQYIPPELRTNTGEIQAAQKHAIPKLIELKDIRGDLHSHSKWSDGANTMEEMALAAEKLGYEYLAMTDHSQNLRVARGLSLERLKEKKKELDALNKKLKKITILFGTEVDILPDGSIDYPDNILKEFDIVVASVHSRFNQDNTERIIKAMQNPYVHIIGHPSGRLIGRRKPYQIDYEKIFKQAANTGTVLEINSQYLRLDLQDFYIREAKRWKCKFSIDSDSHTTASLELMELGVRWARRGWCEKKDVVNALELEKLRKALK
ncbi:DNA polymerase III [Candidatus Peregrinibacteria bacterium CG11_big_fil_rev_8_21_14_0_20_46_8]|nr:MAG: DNA polymerase III [Candidatus Peregrinibacteria bacterium CG11_big_fil_rev_8_21_14_0_20_46_8]